jgi:hypothetical protein
VRRQVKCKKCLHFLHVPSINKTLTYLLTYLAKFSSESCYRCGAKQCADKYPHKDKTCNKGGIKEHLLKVYRSSENAIRNAITKEPDSENYELSS